MQPKVFCGLTWRRFDQSGLHSQECVHTGTIDVPHCHSCINDIPNAGFLKWKIPQNRGFNVETQRV